jgi:hypothetical protein
MSEAAVMDMEALDEILAPYKKQAGEPRPVGAAPDGDQAEAQPTESVTAPSSAQQTMDAVKQQVEAATQQ